MLRGYLDQLSVAPGAALPARLSGDDQVPAVQVLRFRHSDPNPAGPGVLAEPQDWQVTQLREVRPGRESPGSAGLVPGCFPDQVATVTFCAWIEPTRLDGEPVIAAWQAGSQVTRLLLLDGRLALVADQPLIVAPHVLHERQWYFVAASLSERGQVTIAWGQLGRTGGPYTLTGNAPAVPVPSAGSPFVLGGTLDGDGRPQGWFDGTISAATLLSSEPDPIALMDIMNWGVGAAAAQADVTAQWAFGPAADLDKIVDLSGHGRDGSLLNAPSLGVTGPPPVGSDVTAVPPAGPPYLAVHFHRDDLADCQWPQTHELVIPADADSGCYVVRAIGRDGTVDLPFVVGPSGRPPVLLLAPTFTWQAYANLGRDPRLYPGRSHYAQHDDGSPVYISTRRKPMPGIGPAARVEVDAVDSFLASDQADEAAANGLFAAHLLMADLYVSYWLDRTGADFGVITDADLHADGDSALAGCRALVLSAHPEYWTGAMLDALGQFIDGGGSVMYLGGNGLYWVTSVHPTRPYLLEVRRWAGSQTSNADPGERQHTFEPRPGGTWSDSGRPPDQLVSVGFAGFGYGQAIGYLRTPASYEPEFAWVFDGTTGSVIGTEGLNQGGAVGFEFDRLDPALAPPGSTVLATAVPAGGSFFRNYELGIGRAPDPETRCDLVIRRTPAGGLVFSLGSITASGCLPLRNGRNDLARICTNVLDAILRPGGPTGAARRCCSSLTGWIERLILAAPRKSPLLGPTVSAVSAVDIVVPGVLRISVDAGDVGQAPGDLGQPVGRPVWAVSGHLRAWIGLRDPVGDARIVTARIGPAAVADVPPPVAFPGPQIVQVRVLARYAPAVMDEQDLRVGLRAGRALRPGLCPQRAAATGVDHDVAVGLHGQVSATVPIRAALPAPLAAR